MKLLCVLPNNMLVKEGLNDNAKLCVGSKYTLDYVVEYSGETYYKVMEIEGAAFNVHHFATLPDASADEMADVEKEAIVNIETVLV